MVKKKFEYRNADEERGYVDTTYEQVQHFVKTTIASGTWSIASQMDCTNVDNLIKFLQDVKKQQKYEARTRQMYETLKLAYGTVAACEFARDHIEPLVFED